jgi:hypothetical protein
MQFKPILPLAFILLLATSFSTAQAGGTFDVIAFGAAGNGTTDDTAAIQRAIDAAKHAGGGTVYFPARTYLVDSCFSSPHPWFFYTLLIDGSNVTLSGQKGAKLLQGPKGRHPVLAGATEVRNTVLVFGFDSAIIRFQNPAYNGGFFRLKATRAGAAAASLANAADVSHFATGDYVAIYAWTTGDVIPTETSRVVSVDAPSGTLVLSGPLARAFQSPSIVKVTSIATTNVGIKNLVVEGTEPLAVTETFGFTAEDNRFVLNTAAGGRNVTGLNFNTLDGFRFSRNTVTCSGPAFSILELPQRNSRNGVLEDNTFEVRQTGMGEYAAHWRFTGNTFILRPDVKTTVGLGIGGLDIDFHTNRVEGGNLVGGGGFGSLMADYNAPDDYAPYVGRIRITDNVFSCRADGNACLGLFAPDTVVTGNTITVRGSGNGIHAEGPLPQSLVIRNNRLTMGTGNGMVIVTPLRDGSTITHNTISGSKSAAGIFVASPKSPNAGAHAIADNTITGFGTEVSIDRAKHPGTKLSPR